MSNIIDGMKDLWCDWTHGGGNITRDSIGRINWQCAKCGRWSNPVELADENDATDLAIKNAAAWLKANHQAD